MTFTSDTPNRRMRRASHHVWNLGSGKRNKGYITRYKWYRFDHLRRYHAFRMNHFWLELIAMQRRRHFSPSSPPDNDTQAKG